MLLWERYQGIIIALVLSNVESVGFLLSKMWSEQNSTYSFLLWNLMLALLPLCF